MGYNNDTLPSRYKTGLVRVMYSLRGKLAVSHLAVIFVTMTVAGFSLLSLVRAYFLQAMEGSLVTQAHLITQALIPGAATTIPPSSLAPAYNTVQQQQVANLSVQVESIIPSSDPVTDSFLTESNLAYLSDATVGISAALETHIRVLDTRGVVLVDSVGREVGKDISDAANVIAALGGEQLSTTQRVGGEDWLYVSVPLWVEDKVAGVIYLGQPMRDVAAVLSDLRLRLLMAALLAMPLSALVGLALARTIAQPLGALTTAAGKLSAGDFDYPLPADGQDELGRLSRAFVIMRDQLQAVEQMRTQFVSDVSHELRTPLTAIKGLIETLQDGAADDPVVRDRFLASIEGETDRLIRLVNDLLILSRADAQAIRLRCKQVDLRALAHATLEKLAPQAVARQVDLSIDFVEDSLQAFVDPDRIEQVLVNLLDNAFKHTPARGAIRVEGHRIVIEGKDPQPFTSNIMPSSATHLIPTVRRLPAGRWAVITVIDNGEGISPNDLPHVFERFYRADPARSRDRGGSGLGLPIAKALVEAHGGQIWVDSPTSSKDGTREAGTMASFALPLS